MQYFIGAYYLIKLKKLDFGTFKNKQLYTCSTCINDSYFDSWSLSWTGTGKKINAEVKEKFSLDDDLVKIIQKWSDQKFEENKIGWISTFANLETLLEYKTNFFPNAVYEILSINFSASEKKELLDVFHSTENGLGEIGISQNLNEHILENCTDENIGFDLIGIESSGDFHSFHCHNAADELKRKFNIDINEYGLISKTERWIELVEYMNDESNGFKNSPWFYVKVNRVLI